MYFRDGDHPLLFDSDAYRLIRAYCGDVINLISVSECCYLELNGLALLVALDLGRKVECILCSLDEMCCSVGIH